MNQVSASFVNFWLDRKRHSKPNDRVWEVNGSILVLEVAIVCEFRGVSQCKVTPGVFLWLYIPDRRFGSSFSEGRNPNGVSEPSFPEIGKTNPSPTEF